MDAVKTFGDHKSITFDTIFNANAQPLVVRILLSLQKVYFQKATIFFIAITIIKIKCDPKKEKFTLSLKT